MPNADQRPDEPAGTTRARVATLGARGARAVQPRKEEHKVPVRMACMRQERASPVSGFSYMQSSLQYRVLAEECLRLASMAELEHHRNALTEMAKAWTSVADEEEGKNYRPQR